MADASELATNSEESQTTAKLTPMEWPEGYVPGKLAPWYCSPEDIYGPDELGDFESGVEELIKNVNKCDAAARTWEVLQAWEMRLFCRNYQFLNAGWKGWGMYGGSSGTTGASILQTQNAMKLFSCNVIGARQKKITALLSRQVPGTTITAVDDEDPMDQAASEEAEKFLQVFIHQAGLKQVVTKMARLFCTDGRVGTLTYTVADQTRWGTEMPNRKEEVYGAPESDGITPETELNTDTETGSNSDQESNTAAEGGEQPSRREVTFVGGKLEWKVPLMADEEEEMAWIRYQHEVGVNMLKSKYPWIKDKIGTQGNVGTMEQIDRLARINVRLAVQSSSSTGEAYKNDATETVTFFRPSEYEGIADDAVREMYQQTFPDGLEVWHAGGTLAFIRNARMSRHVKIIHPGPGDGQNREALLTNYLPLQKVLNANISLIDRYHRSAIPRRFAGEPYIDTQLLNTTSNDPAKVTAVAMSTLPPGTRIADITAVEQVPVPNDSIFAFVQWLINGGPEAMDGGSAAAFGEADGESDQGVFKTTRLKRDQALQVYSMPWGALCDGVCSISQQAIESAADNRIADVSASLPGQKKLKIEISKLQGSVLVQPESLEIPQTIAEQEEQMADLVAQSANVAFYQQIMLDPRNISKFMQMPLLSKLESSIKDQVEEQQGEFEILMKSGPIPNPQIEQIKQQVAQLQQQLIKGETHPEAQTPEGQQVMQQLQQQIQQLTQAMQSLPPEVSTIPVAQDTSENHMVHAAITLGMLSSPTGRKLKFGNEEQKAIWQNMKLHWLEHMDMLKKLQPPKEMEFKGSVTVNPSDYPPEAQGKMFESMGIEIPPFALQTQESTHEITQEKEGVDAQGVPVKQKVSISGAPLK